MTTVSSGQTSAVSSGSPSGGWVVLSGGTLNVVSGGFISGAIVDGGLDNVLLGGTAIDTIVNNGGEENIHSGGVATGSIVSRGGDELINSLGGISGVTVEGGTLELAAGSIVSGGIAFAGTGGTVKIDGTVMPTSANVISGFVPGNTIDLAGVSFTSGGSVGLSGHVLEISAGGAGSSFSLHLDPSQSYSGESFKLSADGSGGTEIQISDGFSINVTYDQSVFSGFGGGPAAPAGFMQAVSAAVQFYESAFLNPITLNIDVGYGEVNGQALASGNIGQSEFNGNFYNYAQLKGALSANATSLDDSTAVGTLPTVDPTSGGNYLLSEGEQKALGLIAGNSNETDGYVGLNNADSFTYDPSNRAVAGEFDAIGDIEHEISEVMGRVQALGENFGPNVYEPLDLFRYSSSGIRDLTYGDGYFSIDGTNLLMQYNNPNSGGDPADWLPAIKGDSYGTDYEGLASLVSPTDLREMNIIGYDRPLCYSGQTISIGFGEIIASAQVFSGGTLKVLSGGTITDATVLTGGTLEVLSGALFPGTTFSTGAILEIASGFTEDGFTVSSGLTLEVGPGGIASGVIVAGGTVDVLAGGTAGSMTISSGGFVQNLGTTDATTVDAGGGLVIFAGATDSGTTISNGGTETVSSGGTALSATALSIGVLNVLVGGVASGTTDSGGADVVSGTASGTKVDSGGIEAVFGPGTSLSATVVAAGIQYVLSGGHASGTTDSGGADIVLAGGVASGTRVAGGTEVASSGGTLLSATALAGGIQYVLSGGIASGTTDSGGVDIVLAGGVESGTTIGSGGIEVASSGASLLSTTVLAGGIQYVLSGGAASGTTDNGGVDIVLDGGIESGTRVSNGGIEVESSGGTSLSATVLAGGVEYALSGGVARGTLISGGNEQILSSGRAVGATVEGGGFLVVSSGGMVNGATISGATVEIQSGGLTGTNAITYAGGAALILDASANFSGTIAGFTGGDFLDLKDIAFGSNTSMNFVEAGNNLSGTLSVTDGSHTANITLLGSYTPGQFSSATDGHGGTVITDPPVLLVSMPDANALLWQPTSSEAATKASSVELRGGAVSSPAAWQGPTVHLGGVDLLWQSTTPLAAVGVMAGAGFLQDGTLSSLTMHLGG